MFPPWAVSSRVSMPLCMMRKRDLRCPKIFSVHAFLNRDWAMLNSSWASVGVAANGLRQVLVSGYALSAAMANTDWRSIRVLALELLQILASWVDPWTRRICNN